ncbi:hypothetical protein Xen7305DRAFT_00051690 [Xenococcus sp. PCC 7305]|uniref:hypothetical protein n=1 Tax=Xenococcus sp. PCC 7305 TaxID=102125 RepID=UPI0002ABB041|nr:hypothetical protein [Xenococcus sp. PCC 7305]ELS05425.1 hypothetical protein Xen7305DRAFT_00051690 [Xenococcus sp. PCC 7305]
MSDNTSNVPSPESSLDSQSTENNEHHPPTINNKQEDKPEAQNPSQLVAESQSNNSTPKNIDWQKLAHKLREHNRKLLKRVFILEQEIAEAQNRGEEQNNRFTNNNLLLEQQAEKLNEHQEEVANLLQEVENSQQKLQEQQVLAQDFAQKLERSQQEIAKIERECTKLQDDNNDKNYKIVAANKQIKELQNRLDRQQQNTLKYRAMLEKYMSQGEASPEKVLSPSFPQVHQSEPIKSWSEAHEPEKVAILTRDLVELTESSEVSPLLTAKKEASVKSNSNWPAPEIVVTKKENQPKSIAAVKLPSFPRKSSS